MEVDIFIPCIIDQVYPETGMSMVKVLERLDVKVHYNTNQTCCGKLAFTSGFWDEAKSLGTKFIKDFSNGRYVVGPSASCVGYVRNYYEELFYNTVNHLEYQRLKKQIFEFTDFLVNVLKVEDVGASFESVVTYHDSCSALREYGIKEEPRKLLRKVKGLQLVEMKDTDVCCGFGGSFSVQHRDVSIAMAEQKVHNAIETGAKYIVSADASCLMHQEAYIKKNSLPIKIKHIADILASLK